MYLNAVTVCVGYSTELALTLPTNKLLFDNYTIVTDFDDKETKKLCDFYHVRCLQTNVFYNSSDRFNKGAGISEGIENMNLSNNKNEWIIHLDADIWLPPFFRNVLNNRQLNPRCLYGVDRLMCESLKDYINFILNPTVLVEGNWALNMSIFPIGTRLVYHHTSNWCPLGYFQMWNPSQTGIDFYINTECGADKSDIAFAKLFSEDHRSLIPELVCVHIEEGKSETGKNWYGRVSKPLKYS